MTAIIERRGKPVARSIGYAAPAGNRILVYLVLILAALAFAVPIYVVLTTSLKTLEEIRVGTIFDLPGSLNFDAWAKAWSGACTGLVCEGISGGFWNSVKITVPAVFFSVLLGALNGYALSQWRFRGADLIMAALIVGACIPLQVVLYPLVRVLSTVGLYSTLPGIILLHIAFGLPYTTLLFRNYFVSVPNDLVRAARVEGIGFFATFWFIMLPMSVNVIIVATIIQATGIWNDYLLGLIFAGSENAPMMVQVNNIVTVGRNAAEYNVNMAAASLAAIPPLVVYFVAGKYFVRSIGSGAVKG